MSTSANDREATLAIVAVSPHLDDAALSASVRLYGAHATVLTVFAGMPAPGLTVSLWDRLTGASSSAERLAERLAEDAAVMSLLSARGSYLDEREVQYRQPEPAPDIDRLAGRIAEHLTGASEVLLPAAIGRHPDHVLARDAGLRAAAATGHRDVVLYADFPYVITYGWPSWVSGQPADPYLNSEVWLAEQFAAAGLDAPVRSAEVIRLSSAQRAAKVEIISAYRTQASALGLTPAALARDPAKLDYELCWRLAVATVSAESAEPTEPAEPARGAAKSRASRGESRKPPPPRGLSG
jgi:LmbE family N-acetylglucosaminyl deacetylase